MGYRVQHGFGSAFEQIGEADVELSLAQADGVVDGDESIETNVHGRRGRAGTEFAIGFVKDFGELWGHVEGRVAEAAVSRQLTSAISKTNLSCCAATVYWATHWKVTPSRSTTARSLVAGLCFGRWTARDRYGLCMDLAGCDRPRGHEKTDPLRSRKPIR